MTDKVLCVQELRFGALRGSNLDLRSKPVGPHPDLLALLVSRRALRRLARSLPGPALGRPGAAGC